MITAKSSFDRRKVLVLNKCWTPINTITLRNAITLVFGTHSDGQPKARIIEPESYQALSWEDWSALRPKATDAVIRSANLEFRVPEVIVLSKYDKLPKPKAHFSRRNIYKRDNLTCQYCGKKFRSNDLNIDHVIPRSQGGQTTWENCVISCIPCNSRKANRRPAEAGMKLLSVPKKPSIDFLRLGDTKPVDSWKAFISESYWNINIEED